MHINRKSINYIKQTRLFDGPFIRVINANATHGTQMVKTIYQTMRINRLMLFVVGEVKTICHSSVGFLLFFFINVCLDILFHAYYGIRQRMLLICRCILIFGICAVCAGDWVGYQCHHYLSFLLLYTFLLRVNSLLPMYLWVYLSQATIQWQRC